LFKGYHNISSSAIYTRVENLRPATTFDMARIRIFVTQFETHRVKMEHSDKQVL